MDGPGFLEVFVEPLEDRPLLPRLEIVEIQVAFQTNSADEGEKLSVGRDEWARRATLNVDDDLLFPGLELPSDDG